MALAPVMDNTYRLATRVMPGSAGLCRRSADKVLSGTLVSDLCDSRTSISLFRGPFSWRVGACISYRSHEFQHAPVMFSKGLIESPRTVLEALFQFVVGTGYLLRERCQFAQFCYTIEGVLPPSDPCGRRQL